MARNKKVSSRKGVSGGPKLKPDPITERLVPNPADVPDLRVLIGLLGKSSMEGYWRFYLSLDLDEYVEILESDIVHSESISHVKSQIGGTIIWVKQTAQLHLVKVEPKTGTDFLKGPLTAGFLPRTDLGGLYPKKASHMLEYQTVAPCTRIIDCQ